MAELTLDRSIAAPAEVVWAILVEPKRLPEFSESTVEVESSGPITGVGDEFEQTVRLGGRSFTSTWVVTQFVEGEQLTVEGSVLPGTRYSMSEQLRSLGPTRCVLALTMDYKLPFGPLGRLAGKLGAERAAVTEAEQVLDGIAAAAQVDDELQR